MVALSILGLNWCQHAGWKIVLYDAKRGRRLQVTLSPEDAVVIGRELARQPSDRSGLYVLVGALLRQQPHFASVNLALADGQRARAALVLRHDDDEQVYPTTATDGVALAVRVRLPIFADEALLEVFGVSDEPDAASSDDAPGSVPIPAAFLAALDGPQADA